MKNILLILLVVSCAQSSLLAQRNYLQTRSTTVLGTPEADGDEDDPYQLQRKQAWDAMHRTAPGVDWRVIEAANRITNYKNLKDRGILKSNNANARGIGCSYWVERGSANQAGRCDAVDYDSSTNALYVFGDGGVLYKGVPDSAAWVPLNDQLQFNNNILKMVNTGDGNKRIIASMGLQMYYSDDDGLTFNPSTGISFPVAWGGNEFVQLAALDDTAQTMYLITRPWDPTPWAQRFWLYQSTDKGQTWNKIYTFSFGDDQHLVMWVPYGQQQKLYALLNEDNANVSTLYTISGASVASTNTSTSLPTNVSLLFNGFQNSAATVLYAITNANTFYKSSDLGHTWVFVDSTPASIYYQLQVSPADSNTVFIGGVDAYSSYDGGNNWILVNDWTEYGGDPANKLHADIRNIQYFIRRNGSLFTIINCDGGCYRSNDNLLSVNNIGLSGLHVGQFYDIVSDYSQNLFGGTQDQGCQRTDSVIDHNGVIPFDQIISGDYGKLQLTRNRQTLWSEYPGGNMYYWYNSTGGFTSYFNCPGTTKPVYGWMQATAKVFPASNNEIYLAGGNLTGDSGSYIIKLAGDANNITPTQINHDFRTWNGSSFPGISALETTPLDTNKIYVGREDGAFFYSNDAGNNWSQSASFTGPGPFYLFGNCIYASRHTNNVVYYAGSGYSNPGVYKSVDGGSTFTPMAYGLPATLVFGLCANNDESLLFAATEAGPYVYEVADTTWYPLSEGIAPAQSYWAVDFDSINQVAHFATYGRGIWDLHLGTAQSFVTWPGNADTTSAGVITLSGGSPVRGVYSGTGVWNNKFYTDSVAPGVYTLTYTYTDTASGCTETATKTFVVQPTGIEAIRNVSGMLLYPNPTGNKLEIEIQGTLLNSSQIEVMDISGQTLLQKNTGTFSTTELDVSTLTAGMYYLVLQSNGQRLVRKFVRE